MNATTVHMVFALNKGMFCVLNILKKCGYTKKRRNSNIYTTVSPDTDCVGQKMIRYFSFLAHREFPSTAFPVV